MVGAEGADYSLVYARTDPEARPLEGLNAFIVDLSMGKDPWGVDVGRRQRWFHGSAGSNSGSS